MSELIQELWEDQYLNMKRKPTQKSQKKNRNRITRKRGIATKQQKLAENTNTKWRKVDQRKKKRTRYQEK